MKEREITSRTYANCPLCGSTVQREEIQKLGYCEPCRLLIEALTGQQSKSGGPAKRIKGILP
ncbi:MAG: hypothetical protein DDT32_02223 [Syntrophomonadaceae bacterium]|nr:hypothetical protein [Bacillota bacterium]MBT9148449.1 hypothetical protein [Bacillota bacterium]